MKKSKLLLLSLACALSMSAFASCSLFDSIDSGNGSDSNSSSSVSSSNSSSSDSSSSGSSNSSGNSDSSASGGGELPVETTFTVTFDSNGADNVESQTVKEGETATKPTDPVKTSHVFECWTLNGETFDFTTPITEDITLTAKFTQLFTVVFDSDGNGDVASQMVKNGELATKPETDPVKTNFSFDGWTLNGEIFDFNTPIEGDVTLMAKFTQTHAVLTVKSYTENASGEYDSAVIKTETVALDTPIDITSMITEDTIPEGYYYDSENDGNKVIGTVAAEGLELSVYFTKYRTITVNANGGTVTATTKQVEKGSAFDVTATKEGYELVAWLNEDNSVFNTESVITSDVNVKAMWKEKDANYLLDSDISLASFSTNGFGRLAGISDMSVSEDGTGSISMIEWGGWPGLNVTVSKSVDEISAFDYITFWVYIDSDAGFRDDGNKEISILNESKPIRIAPKTWTQIRMTASDFVSKLDANNTMNLLVLQNDGGDYDQGCLVYVDELMLEKREVAEHEIEMCNDSIFSVAAFSQSSMGASHAYVLDVSHTDDGSGCIKMQSNGNAWPNTFVGINKTAEQLAKYQYLSYWVKFESPAGSTNVRVQIPQGGTGYTLDTNRWYQLFVPVSNLTAGNAYGLFNFCNDAMEMNINDYNTIAYIDEIQLVNIADDVLDMCAWGLDSMVTYVGNDSTSIRFQNEYVLDVTHDGNGALYAYEYGSWPTLRMQLTEAQIAKLDVYEKLTWWVYLDCAGGESLEHFTVALDADHKTIVQDKTWTKIEVSTSDIKNNLDDNNQFIIFYTNKKNSGEKYYIDDIRFENKAE